DLVASILELSTGKLDRLQFETTDSSTTIAEFAGLKTSYPYVALIPQEKFLNFLTHEAKKFPNFRILMNAKVTDLIRENNKVKGVVYKQNDQVNEIRACLTIG
ncbi:MAG: FAD-dependent oxidoreductase, partial [Candidatus Dadabacteria bacterium]|nr:FAD-dependent oxidoreductase [Candidatus Dadabacteria bacterium]NIQ49538.1 FAD-dependent oxidoreductase [Hydrotalea flava]